MNRRKFLKFLGIGAGAAAAELIPHNRVWSFPKKIEIPKLLTMEQIRNRAIVDLAAKQGYDKTYFLDRNGLYEVCDGQVQLVNVPIAEELYQQALDEIEIEGSHDLQYLQGQFWDQHVIDARLNESLDSFQRQYGYYKNGVWHSKTAIGATYAEQYNQLLNQYADNHKVWVDELARPENEKIAITIGKEKKDV